MEVNPDECAVIVRKIMNKQDRVKSLWTGRIKAPEKDMPYILRDNAKKILSRVLLKWNKKSSWLCGRSSVKAHLKALYKADRKSHDVFAHLFVIKKSDAEGEDDYETFDEALEDILTAMKDKEMPYEIGSEAEFVDETIRDIEWEDVKSPVDYIAEMLHENFLEMYQTETDLLTVFVDAVFIADKYDKFMLGKLSKERPSLKVDIIVRAWELMKKKK